MYAKQSLEYELRFQPTILAVTSSRFVASRRSQCLQSKAVELPKIYLDGNAAAIKIFHKIMVYPLRSPFLNIIGLGNSNWSNPCYCSLLFDLNPIHAPHVNTLNRRDQCCEQGQSQISNLVIMNRSVILMFALRSLFKISY